METIESPALLERNKRAVRDFIEAINAHDWSRVDLLVTLHVVRHSQTSEQPLVRDREELRAFLQREAVTFPDAHETIEFLIAEDDRVAARLRFRGTQHGAMGPFPPSGNVLDAAFIAIFRLEAGRIAEIWVEWDNLNALVRLGHYRLPT